MTSIIIRHFNEKERGIVESMDYYIKHIFAGQEVAARWWVNSFKSGMGIKTIEEEQPIMVQTACDELVNYLLDSLPGIERILESKEALRVGFFMGASFQRSLESGALEDTGDGYQSIREMLDQIESIKSDLE